MILSITFLYYAIYKDINILTQNTLLFFSALLIDIIFLFMLSLIIKVILDTIRDYKANIFKMLHHTLKDNIMNEIFKKED